MNNSAFNIQLAFSLVIGVGKRPDDDPLMAISASDAERFSTEITQRGLFEEAHINLLQNETATKDAILDQLDNFCKKTTQNPAEMFLFYFSGHGCVKNGKYYLICRDTQDKDIEGTAIEASVFVEKLQAINTDKMVVLLDSCHAAGMTITKNNPLKKEAFSFEKPNRIVLTASHAEQVSFLSQPVSVFTYALIKGLSGAYFQSTDKDVTIFDLAMYIRELVYPLSKRKQQPQFHVLDNALTSNFVLAHYPKGKPEGLVFEERFKLLNASGKAINTDLKPELDENYRKRYQWLKTNISQIEGEGNIVIQDVSDSKINIQTGNTTHQKADKIYNIKKIDKADFS